LTSNLERYLALWDKENELRAEVIRTQRQDVEDERIRVTLEREHLLFEVLTDEEVVEAGTTRQERL
jgi:hypothetical protein